MRRQFFGHLFYLGMVMLVMGIMSSQVLAAKSVTGKRHFSTSKILERDPIINLGMNGEVSFQANTFSEEIGDVIGNRYHGDLKFGYRSGEKGSLEKMLDFHARVNNEEQLQFSGREAYLRYQFGNNAFTLGRVVKKWNEIDDVWGFGKTNNRENFDGFAPGQEGLTGLFFDKKFSNGLGFSLFGSVVYVPELNPGMKIDKEQGTITCQNPWCKAPSESAHMNDKDIPIFYDVQYPDLSEMMFRYSMGGKIFFENKYFGIGLNYLRKPENQISVIAEISYDTEFDRIMANVTPQFYYHDVTGMDLKIKPLKNLELYGSAISINPNQYPDGNVPYIQYTGIQPEKRKEEYVGGGVRYRFKRLKVNLNYVARISEYDKGEDILAEAPRWNQAYNFALDLLLTKRLRMSADFKFDMLTEDRLTTFRADYQWSHHVALGLGVNMIGSSENSESYWSDFMNNDSVYTSLKYRF